MTNELYDSLPAARVGNRPYIFNEWEQVHIIGWIGNRALQLS